MLTKPLIGFSTTWQGVLGARFLDRLGTGIRSAPRDTLIASSVDNQHRGKAFGIEGIGDNLGAFLGPLIAVFLLFSLHIDIRYIFYLAIIPGLAAVLMMLFVKEKQKIKIKKNKPQITIKGQWHWLVLRHSGIIRSGSQHCSWTALG